MTFNKINRTTTMLMCLSTLGAAISFATPARAADADSDKQFLTMAAQSDINEIKLSQLAETKATNPQVKSFAKKMVTDHNRLEGEMKPFATQWQVTPPSGPDSEHQALYDKLNGLSGADFDKAYMDAMSEDHHKALDAFTSEASSTTDAKFKKVVMKGKTVVAGHTTMADDLKGKV